jgi:hypothetical protein
MNKKGVLCLGFLMLASIFSRGQAKLVADNFLTRITSNLKLQGAKQYEAEGSPYLLEEFTLSEVHANNNKALGILVRYNVYEDYMEFQDQGSIYELKPDKSIKEISLGVEKFVVEEYPYKGKSKLGYLHMLHNGRATLLAKKSVNLVPAKEATPMKYDPTPAKFERLQDVLYYRIGDDPLMKVENIKKIIESLPDHKDEMLKFVDENKISARSDDEVVKLFTFYNSL